MATSLSRTVFGSIGALALLIVFFVVFHLGGTLWQFSQLVSALIGGSLTLFSVLSYTRDGKEVEPWLGRERLGWIFIGCGLILWGCGESIWRYYSSIHQSAFPSLADIGYASFPPLVFAGLVLQPSSGNGSRRLLMLLDSLIAMTAMLSIGWYLLLGTLALSSGQNVLAKCLGLYYPTADIALLSCVILLFFRGQGSLYQATARRVSLLVVGLGLCFFTSSDFLFNVQQTAGTYIDGTWIDLGWPLGMLAIGVAAYLRRFLPPTSVDMIERRLHYREQHFTFGFAQLVTYSMLALLLGILAFNVLSVDASQLAIRPMLVMGTIVVVSLVVVRHVLTILDNERLLKGQVNALERLEEANRQREKQARLIAERHADLQAGIFHLKEVQARMANGNLRARARLTSGELLPLGASLNLMAERLAHLEYADTYAQRLTRALQDLFTVVESFKEGEPFMLPPSCKQFPEMNRLLYALSPKGERSMLSDPSQILHTPDLPSVYPPEMERSRQASL